MKRLHHFMYRGHHLTFDPTKEKHVKCGLKFLDVSFLVRHDFYVGTTLCIEGKHPQWYMTNGWRPSLARIRAFQRNMQTLI